MVRAQGDAGDLGTAGGSVSSTAVGSIAVVVPTGLPLAHSYGNGAAAIGSADGTSAGATASGTGAVAIGSGVVANEETLLLSVMELKQLRPTKSPLVRQPVTLLSQDL